MTHEGHVLASRREGCFRKCTTRESKPSLASSGKGTAKAKVITMLGRKGGISLEEIRKATGWQAHTVRGFISLLGSKGGYAISSSRREDGARVYALQK